MFTQALNMPKNILNFGKIRANYAKVGKDASPYQVLTAYNIGSSYVNGTAYYVGFAAFHAE